MTSRPRSHPAALPVGWLVFIYHVPAEPSSRRTYVWRRLKQLGAVYLQQAAAVLPASADGRSALTDLAARVTEFGGEVSLLEAQASDDVWGRGLIERFNRARDAEYAEIGDTAMRLEAEVRRETSRDKFSFAELEEIEADWARLRRWHARVRARDTFVASGGAAARTAAVAAHLALDGFRAEVYRREGLESADEEPPGHDGPG